MTTWLTTRVLPREPAGKQTFQFYIYTVKGTATLSIDQPKFSFLKDSFYPFNFFYSTNSMELG